MYLQGEETIYPHHFIFTCLFPLCLSTCVSLLPGILLLTLCVWPRVRILLILQLFISSYDLLLLQSVAIRVPNKPMIEGGQPRAGEDNITPHYNKLASIRLFSEWLRNLNIHNISSFFPPQWYKTSKVFQFFLHSLQCAEKAVSFMLLYLMLHKLAYIVHLFEMKGRNRWALNGLVSLNRPPSPPDYWRLWSIASTWAHNRKHQISRPVESTFGFVQQGPTQKESVALSVPESSRVEPFVQPTARCPAFSSPTPFHQVFWKGHNVQDIFYATADG